MEVKQQKNRQTAFRQEGEVKPRPAVKGLKLRQREEHRKAKPNRAANN